MPTSLSHVPYDILVEILGYFPVMDILQLRMVCRRFFQASKKRPVWINALSAAQCPIPDVNVAAMSTRAIENFLVRAEIMDDKWLGIRPTLPWKLEKSGRRRGDYCTKDCASMPPYVFVTDWGPNCVTYQWYRVGEFETPVMQYQHKRPSKYCYATDPCGSKVTIAYMEDPDVSPDQEDKTTRLLKIVKFEISGEGVISKTEERDMLWPNFSVPSGAKFWLALLDDYVITQPDQYDRKEWPLSLLHIGTGRTYTCSSYIQYGRSYKLYIASSTTFSYLVQRHDSTFFFCKFPSQEEMETSTGPPTLRLTHSGSFSEEIYLADVFPRSASTFTVIGLSLIPADDDDDCISELRHITVNLSPHSSTCDMHEDFCCTATGRFISYTLAQCSSASRSTLGVLSLRRGHLPTHTATGKRIPRDSRFYLYHLGVHVEFGAEGSSPRIDLTEINLVPLKDRTDRVYIKDFNPYTGQAIIDAREFIPSVQNPPWSRNQGIIMTDYASPE